VNKVKIYNFLKNTALFITVFFTLLISFYLLLEHHSSSIRVDAALFRSGVLDQVFLRTMVSFLGLVVVLAAACDRFWSKRGFAISAIGFLAYFPLVGSFVQSYIISYLVLPLIGACIIGFLASQIKKAEREEIVYLKNLQPSFS